MNLPNTGRQLGLVPSPSDILPEHLPETGGAFTSEGEIIRPDLSIVKPTHLLHGEVRVGSETSVWTLEVPEDLAYDGLVVVIPGYGGIKRSSRKPRNGAAQEGYAALSYEPVRKAEGSFWEQAANPQEVHVQTLRAIRDDLDERRSDLRKMPSGVDYMKWLAWAHSMGGAAAIRFAFAHLSMVDMVAQTATIGYGHPTLAELAVDMPFGLAASAQHEFFRMARQGDIDFSVRNLWRVMNYYIKLQAMLEARSCLREDLCDKTATVRARGIEVDYTGLQHDILVRPALDVAQFVTRHEVMGGAGHLAFIIKARDVFRRVANLEQSRTAA